MKKLFIQPLSNTDIKKAVTQETKWKTPNQNSAIVECLVPIQESEKDNETSCKLAIHEFLFKNVISNWQKNVQFSIDNYVIVNALVDSFVIIDQQIVGQEFHMLVKAKISFTIEQKNAA